jgi:hypothetical protein
MANIIVTAHSLSLRLVRMTLKSSSSTREVYTIGAQETNGEDMMERGVDGQQYLFDYIDVPEFPMLQLTSSSLILHEISLRQHSCTCKVERISQL